MHPLRARICVREETRGPGKARARVLERPADGLAVYDHYAALGEQVTLLLNDVETVDPGVARLQDQFAIPYGWRRGNAVATLSARHGGIGFHAGTEDGFIVQLRGARTWRVWRPDVLPEEYLRELLGHPARENAVERPAKKPALSCVLRPGDALYIPALFPHEGVTREESLSLSLGWEGISLFQVFRTLGKTELSADVLDDAAAAGLFRLLDDPPPGADPKTFLRSSLRASFSAIAETYGVSAARLTTFADRLVEKGAGATRIRRI